MLPQPFLRYADDRDSLEGNRAQDVDRSGVESGRWTLKEAQKMAKA